MAWGGGGTFKRVFKKENFDFWPREFVLGKLPRHAGSTPIQDATTILAHTMTRITTVINHFLFDRCDCAAQCPSVMGTLLDRGNCMETLQRDCRRHGWIILLFTLFFSVRLLAGTPIPPTNGTPSNPWLDSWSFADTNHWTSDPGFYPMSYSNIAVSAIGPCNSLDIDCQTNAWLQFNVYEPSGATNLNIVSDGSVVFWFAPN